MNASGGTIEKRIGIKAMLLIMGIGTLSFNLFDKHNRYYLGEPLVEKEITIDKTLKYVEGSKSTNRYILSGEGYRCRFWISEGGYSIIKDDERIERRIKSIERGDVLKIKIRRNDEPDLQNGAANLRIIELSDGPELLICASEVQKRDWRHFIVSMSIAGVCLLSCAIIQIRDWVLKSRSVVP